MVITHVNARASKLSVKRSNAPRSDMSLECGGRPCAVVSARKIREGVGINLYNKGEEHTLHRPNFLHLITLSRDV